MALFRLYREVFTGISRPQWFLALVMLINRSGTMVVPFMGIYMQTSQGYSLEQVGWVLGCFGIGSVMGGFAGGWLTDRVGAFRVQFGSLVLGGFQFFTLLLVTELEALCGAVFLIGLISDAVRPANSASIALYSEGKNLTKAYSLNRLAINLGYSIGPALGGFVAAYDFNLLFWIDGITCILAGCLYFILFRNAPVLGKLKKVEKTDNQVAERSPFQDGWFMVFMVLTHLLAVVFFQLFTTLPIYFQTKAGLSEQQIGYLLSFNGAMIFLLEMFLVHIIGEKFNPFRLISLATAIMGLAYLSLLIAPVFLVGALCMLLLTFGEMFSLPFISTVVAQWSGTTNKGRYMGVYTVAFSSALAVAPSIGAWVADALGFDRWWMIVACAAFGLSAIFWILPILIERRPR